MRTLILVILLLLITTVANAIQVCQRDGMEAVNCQSEQISKDGRRYIYDGNLKITTKAIANARGWYELVITEPDDTGYTNPVKDEVIWGFEDNKITKTWKLREMRQDEVDVADSDLMDDYLYLFLKWQAAEGKINPATAPAALKKAFLAKQRLGK